MPKNTTPESYDEITDTGSPEAMTQEEILQSEGELLSGLLELSRRKDEASNYHNIEIRHNGAVKLRFRIRPVTEDEVQLCTRRAQTTAPAKGRQPRQVLDTDASKFRSLMIYTATVDEDRERIWNNRKMLVSLNLLEGWQMVDAVLVAGEKSRVLDQIDEISGFGSEDTTEELAKN